MTFIFHWEIEYSVSYNRKGKNDTRVGWEWGENKNVGEKFVGCVCVCVLVITKKLRLGSFDEMR